MSKLKTSKSCIACGNNPTNHHLSWFNQTMGIYMLPIDRKIIGGFLGRMAGKIIHTTAPYYIYLFSVIGLVKLNNDRERATTERSRVVWDEAENRGIWMRQIVFLGKPIDFYIAQLNKKKKVFESIPMKPNTSGSDIWMDDKFELKKRLENAGIAVPRGRSVKNFKDAEKVFEGLNKPVIVKPRLGSRGRHTTTHIYTKEELKAAYTSAKKLCHFVVIEEQIMGSVYRGTLVNRKLVGVLQADPPKILGDGEKTIETLIEEKNKYREESVGEVVINEKLKSFILRQGYTIQSVLPQFLTLDLSEKIGLPYGGDTIEITPLIHPNLKIELEKAGKVVDASVIGFDFIIPDPYKDPHMQQWGIIECNSLPFINLHYHPRIGTPINVAGYIWDLWQK